jgi:hypothetical protein
MDPIQLPHPLVTLTVTLQCPHTCLPHPRSVYISGLPGTGKSHTVRAVLRSLGGTSTAGCSSTQAGPSASPAGKGRGKGGAKKQGSAKAAAGGSSAAHGTSSGTASPSHPPPASVTLSCCGVSDVYASLLSRAQAQCEAAGEVVWVMQVAGLSCVLLGNTSSQIVPVLIDQTACLSCLRSVLLRHFHYAVSTIQRMPEAHGLHLSWA